MERESKKTIATLTPSAEDYALAKALHTTFLRKGLINPRKSKALKWAPHIAALTQIDKHERERVLDVINYYLEHFIDPYAPRAYSGQSIRDRFFDLCAFFDRNNKNYNLQITTKAREYGERIWNFGWKFYELKEQIPILTQLSLDNILRFKAQLSARRLEEETKLFRASKGLLRSIPELLLDHLHDEYNEVCRHFFMVHKRVSDWAAWNGRLDNCVISLDNEEWMRTLTNLCGHYCGEEGISTFKQIVKECK